MSRLQTLTSDGTQHVTTITAEEYRRLRDVEPLHVVQRDHHETVKD